MPFTRSTREASGTGTEPPFKKWMEDLKRWRNFNSYDNDAARVSALELRAAEDVKEKIASFLLGRVRRAQRLGGGGNSVDLPMSRHDIGDFLGLTTETVSRCFTSMKNDNIIKLDGASLVRLVDKAQLEQLASGNH